MKSSTVGGVTTTYTYDGDGKRVSKTISGVTTTYVYDMGGGLPVLLDDGTNKYVWGAGGLAYNVDKSSGAVGIYHTDGLGSVRAITDRSGSVVRTFEYEEFGAQTQTQGSVTQAFGFTGEQVDSSGFVNLRARTYDTSLGRFFQRDPLSRTAPGITGWNRYIYATGNPTSLLGPTGLCSSAACRTEYQGLIGLDRTQRLELLVEATNALRTTLHIALDIAAVPPYGAYYISYGALGAVNTVGDRYGPLARWYPALRVCHSS